MSEHLREAGWIAAMILFGAGMCLWGGMLIASFMEPARKLRNPASGRRASTNADGSVLVDPDYEWTYTVPPTMGSDVLLLTRGRFLTRGRWYGDLGEHFVAWAPMPKRNKAEEKRLGLPE